MTGSIRCTITSMGCECICYEILTLQLYEKPMAGNSHVTLINISQYTKKTHTHWMMIYLIFLEPFITTNIPLNMQYALRYKYR